MFTMMKLTHPYANRIISLFLIAASLTIHSGQAAAQERNYLIEVVVFENLDEAKKANTGSLYYPRINSAFGLNSDKAASNGFAVIEDSRSLDEAADKIRGSRGFRVLNHFAWRQPGLDARNAQAIRISIGNTLPVYVPDDLKPYPKFFPASAQPQPTRSRKINTTTVNGTLKVRLGRFLHLDAQLVFTDTENLKSYRLSQSRKMRSGELHYIDNPRFGLLVKILPIDATEN